jgi:hypothetical protein
VIGFLNFDDEMRHHFLESYLGFEKFYSLAI